MVLRVSNHARLQRFTGLCAGAAGVRLHHVEAPLSGMSMNPARSFGPALLAGDSSRSGSTSLRRSPACCWRPSSSCGARRWRGAAAPSSITRPTPVHLPLPLRHVGRLAVDLVSSRGFRMSATNHYDVIIIGTGAGGGTLAYRLAPSGKRILLLERGDYVPREKDNWNSRAVNVDGEVPDAKEVWRDARRQAAASAHQLLRRRQHQILRRGAVPAARARTSASCATTAASRRPGRSATTISSRTTPRRSGSIRCTASAATIRPSRRRARRIRIPRSATSRASSSCTTTSRGRAAAVPHAARRHARRAEPADQPLHPLRHLRRLPVPGQRQDRRAGRLRRSGARASERHAADRRLRRRGSRRAPSGREVTRVVVERDGAPESLSGGHRRRLVRRDQLGGAAAALGERPASARPGQRLGRRRPPLHGPHQLGAAGASRRARTRRCSRRRSA